jgi:hypothetical protein
MRAQEEKDKGNAAFAAQDYETAVKHFTTCIELDPRWGPVQAQLGAGKWKRAEAEHTRAAPREQPCRRAIMEASAAAPTPAADTLDDQLIRIFLLHTPISATRAHMGQQPPHLCLVDCPARAAVVCRDAVYFSNRSAAYANLGKFDEALTDAQVGAARGRDLDVMLIGCFVSCCGESVWAGSGFSGHPYTPLLLPVTPSMRKPTLPFAVCAAALCPEGDQHGTVIPRDHYPRHLPELPACCSPPPSSPAGCAAAAPGVG